MNQILDKNYINKQIQVEFGNDMFEIPYEENKMKYKLLHYLKTNKYRLQFFISIIIALLIYCIIFTKYINSNKQEKFSKKLLSNYSLTTLYQGNSSNKDSSVQTPFVIGMIKINQIDLLYPILSQSSEDLLKISLCRFSGPMPNEAGNLCIVGHNYIDNRFFSRLSELSNGNEIEIYDLNGKKLIYTVYNKYEVQENDLSCTSQNTSNQKIITLITCNNINSNKRLIVQAKEK